MMSKASTKKCTVCEIDKEILEENKRKQAEHNKKWRDKNKEKISKQKREKLLNLVNKPLENKYL